MGEAYFTTDFPAPLAKVAHHTITLLGLSEWDLWFSLADSPGTDGNNGGICDCNFRYLRAEISIARGVSLAEQRQHLIHELLHVATGLLRGTIVRAEEELPKAVSGLLSSLITDEVERTIERLRRALEAAGVFLALPDEKAPEVKK